VIDLRSQADRADQEAQWAGGERDQVTAAADAALAKLLEGTRPRDNPDSLAAVDEFRTATGAGPAEPRRRGHGWRPGASPDLEPPAQEPVAVRGGGVLTRAGHLIDTLLANVDSLSVLSFALCCLLHSAALFFTSFLARFPSSSDLSC
jgi:hypothetical protein